MYTQVDKLICTIIKGKRQRKCQPSSLCSGREGFSLVEVVVACAIFTMGLAGVFGLTGWLMRANAYSNKLTEATTLAQGKLEEVMSGTFASLTSGNDASGIFQRSWDVSVLGIDLRGVEVNVVWSDIDERSHTVTLSNIKSQ